MTSRFRLNDGAVILEGERRGSTLTPRIAHGTGFDLRTGAVDSRLRCECASPDVHGGLGDLVKSAGTPAPAGGPGDGNRDIPMALGRARPVMTPRESAVEGTGAGRSPRSPWDRSFPRKACLTSVFSPADYSGVVGAELRLIRDCRRCCRSSRQCRDCRGPCLRVDSGGWNAWNDNLPLVRNPFNGCEVALTCRYHPVPRRALEGECRCLSSNLCSSSRY